MEACGCHHRNKRSLLVYLHGDCVRGNSKVRCPQVVAVWHLQQTLTTPLFSIYLFPRHSAFGPFAGRHDSSLQIDSPGLYSRSQCTCRFIASHHRHFLTAQTQAHAKMVRINRSPQREGSTLVRDSSESPSKNPAISQSPAQWK